MAASSKFRMMHVHPSLPNSTHVQYALYRSNVQKYHTARNHHNHKVVISTVQVIVIATTEMEVKLVVVVVVAVEVAVSFSAHCEWALARMRRPIVCGQWLAALLVWTMRCFLWDTCMAAIRSTTGTPCSLPHVDCVGLRQRISNDIPRYGKNSAEWCCSTFLPPPADTVMTTSTLMPLRGNGRSMHRSRYCTLLRPANTRRSWLKQNAGVGVYTLQWPTASGSRVRGGDSTAAAEHWTRWTDWLECSMDICTPNGFVAGSWSPSKHVWHPARPRTMHIARLRCLGRRVRRWSCKTKAPLKRMRSRRKWKKRRPRDLSAQAGRLMLVVLHELLLGRHLDALRAIVTSVIVCAVRDCCASWVCRNHRSSLSEQCSQTLCSRTVVMPRLLRLSEQPMLDNLSTPLRSSSHPVTCLGLLRVRPHLPAVYIRCSPVLVLSSLVPSSPGALTWLWTTLPWTVRPQTEAPPPR